MRIYTTSYIILLLIVFLFGDDLKGQQSDISIMFYNVENLFDTIDCSLNDDEFLPLGEKRWNSFRYYSKLNKLSKVIVASGGWDPPSVIGLSEVENIDVLDDLVAYTLLSHYPYKKLYANSFDERGIGVGMLVDTSQFVIDNINLVYPIDDQRLYITTRSILIVRLKNSFDSISVIVSHWPSRRGGVAETEKLRKKVAQTISEEVAKIVKRYGANEKIIIMGDFNCEPDSEVIRSYLLAEDPKNIEKNISGLYNLALPAYGKGVGSYKYQGIWSLFDQIVVSGSLINSENGYSVGSDSFRIYQSETMVIPDTRYNGLKPAPTYSGPVYLGGYSDHLPVLIFLTAKTMNQD